MARQIQDWGRQLDQTPQAGPFFEPISPASERQRSVSVSSDGGEPKAIKSYRQPSLDARHVRTRSVAFGAGVVFERDFTAAPTDDDIIIVTIKTASKFRKDSIDGSDELPSRPRPRSFLRRVSTRWHSNDEDKYKAIKMPRRDYKRYFARDHDRKYVGTEPEREWDEDELMREFGVYQDLPLRSILC